MNASILSHCSICSCGNPLGSLVFQRFHRANIAWNYSMKEEDWCRIVLSMSDGSSWAGNLLRRPICKSLMAVFNQCLTDRSILLTNIYILAGYPASLETLSPGLSPSLSRPSLPSLLFVPAFYPPSLGLPGFAQDNCIPEILLNLEA